MPIKPKSLPLYRQPLAINRFWAELGYPAIEFTRDARLKRTLDATEIHKMDLRTQFIDIANIVSKLVRSKYRLRAYLLHFIRSASHLDAGNRTHPLITFHKVPEVEGKRSPQLVATPLPVKDDFRMTSAGQELTPQLKFDLPAERGRTHATWRHLLRPTCCEGGLTALPYKDSM